MPEVSKLWFFAELEDLPLELWTESRGKPPPNVSSASPYQRDT